MKSHKSGIYTALAVVFLVAMVFSVPVQAQENELPPGVDGQIILENISREGWRIASVAGDGVYAGSGFARVYLEVNGRYHFDLSRVDSDHLPLDFRGLGGRILFSQTDSEADAGIEGIDVQVDDEGVTFTLTDALAGELSFFRATPYPQMTGIITPIRTTADEEPEDGESEDEGA